MGIDLCRTDVCMSEEFLHITNIHSLFEKMGSEAMTKRVEGCLFFQFYAFTSLVKNELNSVCSKQSSLLTGKKKIM